MRRTLIVLAAVLLTAGVLGGVSLATGGAGQSDRDRAEQRAVGFQARQAARRAQVRVRLRTAIRRLPVARERRAGYDRDKFRHWVDADGDCRDTRDEVLAAESRRRARGCDVLRGRWRSYYDRRTWRRSSDVDIDHLVPLAESWDSGARRWNAGTRRRFANDLGDRRSLVAVTDNVNMSKSDQDPREWLPRFGRCRYVREWTAVKTRWSLQVDRREKRTLRRLGNRCANKRLAVRKARIVTRRAGGGGGGGGGTDPRFATCEDAKARGYGPYRRGRDREYRWYTDGDGDGWVCE